MFAIEVHERVEREAVEIDGESNEEMYIYRERERAKEGGLTRHHPQTIKYQLGSCLPAKFISVRGASLLIIRWPISFRETNILRCRMQSLRESLKPLRSRFRSLEIVAFPLLLLLLPLLRSLRSLLASTKINSGDLSLFLFLFFLFRSNPFDAYFFLGF